VMTRTAADKQRRADDLDRDTAASLAGRTGQSVTS
jgi:hypothetical protein